MEPETVVIKVKYGDTLRRFIAPVINQELDLDMDRLRDKICYFFKFSPETDFTLTYIDEDCDLVGLVDDEDLRDVVRQALNPVRITVKVNAEKRSKSRGQSSGQSTPQILKPNTSEALKSVPAEVVDALMKTKEASEDPSLGGKEALTNPESEKIKHAREIVERQLDARKEAYRGNLPQVGPKLAVLGNSDKHPLPSYMGLSYSSPLSDTGMIKDASMRGKEELRNLESEQVRRAREKLKKEKLRRQLEPFQEVYKGNLPQVGLKPAKVDFDPGFIVECPFSGVPVRNDYNTPPQFGNSSIFHRGIRCDGCGVHPITGIRYKSKVKDDYDLCGICFVKMGNETDYTSIDRPVAYCHGFGFSLKGPHRPNEIPLTPPIFKNYKAGSPLKLDSRFIHDVNILDGTIIAPLTPFTKIWRMRNSGTLPWPQNTKLVWIGGDRLTDASFVEIEVPASGLAIDQELDVSVDFVSPQHPGRYISYWRMASPSGQKFGQRVWVLIQVNAYPTEPFHEVGPGFNLNLPPVENDQNDPEIIHKEPQPVMDNSHNDPQNVKFPIDNSLLVGGGESSSSPAISVAPPSSGLYPNTEPALSNPSPVVASTSSTSAVNGEASAEASVEMEVARKVNSDIEEKRLRELEDMGFKQVDLNKEVLRTNEYDLEQSVDDLCGVSEWDPILEELQEMGFEDKEMNKKLLKKNNGSIKRVVMDLITEEGR